MTILRLFAVTAVLAGCGVDTGDDGALDSTEQAVVARTGGVFATFTVGGEPLSIWITNDTGIKQALQISRGLVGGRHPTGKLVCTDSSASAALSGVTPTAGAQEYNAPWSWHLDGATVTFAQTSIELCDGRPSFVESSPCSAFGNGTFCPWSAKLTSLRDCRNSNLPPPSCPLLP